MKKIKCDICNKEYDIKKEDTYIVTKEKKDIFPFSKELFDAIDCPECGCQKILKRRYLKKIEGIREK